MTERTIYDEPSAELTIAFKIRGKKKKKSFLQKL